MSERPVFGFKEVVAAWERDVEDSGTREGPYETIAAITNVRLPDGKVARLGVPDWFLERGKPVAPPPNFQLYFIQRGETGPIKIGVAVDPMKRLLELQTGNAEKLRLLGAVPGSRKLEAKLHRHFRLLRLEGEWFQPHPELVMYANSLLEAQ